jgi:two-component system, NtrC family, response regulator HydG
MTRNSSSGTVSTLPPKTKADDELVTRRVESRFAGKNPAYELVVIAGPDTGQRLAIDSDSPGRQLVGQSVACALRLTDPHVSRRHVAVDVGPAGLLVSDLGSLNGTRVNGLRIDTAYLEGGERIQVGATEIAVQEAAATPTRLGQPTGFGPLVGASHAMRRLYPLLEKLAASHVPVIIEGETGTGKEVLAEALHRGGPRAAGPFVVFDCTTTAPSLIESALFGHERGSFTGASDQRKGVFELANGGTLLIDEIGDLDLALQPKLLRAVQRGEVCRVGSGKWLSVDVRVLVATRRNLDQEVQAGRFRDDLFFRLNVGRVELPPLRQRQGDIVLLARQFWKDLGGGGQPLPLDLFRAWEDLPFPGNVRELYNLVARRLALGELGELGDGGGLRSAALVAEPSVGAAPASSTTSDALVASYLDRHVPFVVAREEVVEDFSRRYLETLLERHGGRVADAARAAGIGHRYFNVIRAKSKR